MRRWFSSLVDLPPEPAAALGQRLGVPLAADRVGWVLQVADHLRALPPAALEPLRLELAALHPELAPELSPDRTPDPAPDLLIVYGPELRLPALALARSLSAAGYRVWVDRWAVRSGASWVGSWREALIGPHAARVLLRGAGPPLAELAETLARAEAERAVEPTSADGRSILEVDLGSPVDLPALKRALAARGVWPSRQDRLSVSTVLRPLSEHENERLIGRDEQVQRLLPLVGQGWLLLTGPTGAGVSSLAAAGLGPAIRCGGLDGRPWEVVVVSLEGEPVRSLARALTRDPARVDTISHGLRASDEDLLIRLHERRVALILDGFEAQSPSERDPRALAPVVRNLARAAAGGVPIITVIAAEHLEDWLQILAAVLPDSARAPRIEPILPLPAGALGALAARVGQPPPLTTRLLKALADHPHRLSHLRYAASVETPEAPAEPLVLFRALDRRCQEAEAVTPDSARRLWLALVTPGKPPLRRRVSRAELDRLAPGEAERWLELGALSERAAREGEAGPTAILAHDVLLSWPTLQRWLTIEVEDASARAKAESAAAAWEAGSGGVASAVELAWARSRVALTPLSARVLAWIEAGERASNEALLAEQAAREELARERVAAERAERERVEREQAAAQVAQAEQRTQALEARLLAAEAAREQEAERHRAAVTALQHAQDGAEAAARRALEQESERLQRSLDQQQRQSDEQARRLVSLEARRLGAERALQRGLRVVVTLGLVGLGGLSGVVWAWRESLAALEDSRAARAADRRAELARFGDLVPAAVDDPGLAPLLIRAALLLDEGDRASDGRLAAALLAAGARPLPGVQDVAPARAGRWEHRVDGSLWWVDTNEEATRAGEGVDELLGADTATTGEFAWFRAGDQLGVLRIDAGGQLTSATLPGPSGEPALGRTYAAGAASHGQEGAPPVEVRLGPDGQHLALGDPSGFWVWELGPELVTGRPRWEAGCVGLTWSAGDTLCVNAAGALIQRRAGARGGTTLEQGVREILAIDATRAVSLSQGPEAGSATLTVYEGGLARCRAPVASPAQPLVRVAGGVRVGRTLLGPDPVSPTDPRCAPGSAAEGGGLEMEVSTPGLTSRLTLPALVMAGAIPLWSDPRAVVWRLPDVVSRVAGVEPLELWDEAGTTWARFEGPAGRVVSAGGWTAAVEGEGVQLTGEEGSVYLPIHAEKLRLSVEGRWLLLDEQRAIRTDLNEARRTACRWVGSEHLPSGACP